MKQYHELLEHILANGIDKKDRTGTGTRSVFGYQMRFDLSKGFPLVTTKKVHLKSIIHELIWFIKGDTNTKYLEDNGVTIWREWSDENGDLGPVYGKQWRRWDGAVKDVILENLTQEEAEYNINRVEIDQISEVINILKTNPDSRRMVVSAWNVADLPDMALAPCHCLFQFYTTELTLKERVAIYVERHPTYAMTGEHEFLDSHGIPKRRLSCQLFQRSADVFLGSCFNIASYSLLTMMIAQVCDMVPGEFIYTLGDAHLYSNHLDQAKEQLSRIPRELPTMKLNPDVKDIDDFKYEDFTLEGYDPHPAIKAPVAI